MDKIIIAEYPKSGGSWLVSMLADALSLEKRDIYISEGYTAFDVSKHPWYEGSKSWNIDGPCVIKSHELPDSSLHDLHAKIVHLIRDGRDVVVSKYFFEKDFCVRNGIFSGFDTPFDQYVSKTATEWNIYVKTWLKTDANLCRYEDLCRDPFSTLERLLDSSELRVPSHRLLEAIELNTKHSMHASFEKTFKYNTFVRKAEPGDWVNHFQSNHKEIFKSCAGELLVRLGYEKGFGW